MKILGNATAGVIGGDREISTEPVTYHLTERVQCARCRRWYADATLLDDDAWCTRCLARWGKPTAEELTAEQPVPAPASEHDEERFAEPPAPIVAATAPTASPIEFDSTRVTDVLHQVDAALTAARALLADLTADTPTPPRPATPKKPRKKPGVQPKPVDIDAAAERYRQGGGIATIAADLKVSERRLRDLLVAAGVTLRTPGQRANQNPVEPIDETDLAAQYRNGASINELQEKFHIGRRRIVDILTAQNVPVRPRGGVPGPRASYDATVVAEAVRLYESGYSVQRTADAIGSTHKTVVGMLAHAGHPLREKQNGNTDGAKDLKARIAALGIPMAELRAWAIQNGHPVGDRGTIPARIVDAWEDTHPEHTATSSDATHQEGTTAA